MDYETKLITQYINCPKCDGHAHERDVQVYTTKDNFLIIELICPHCGTELLSKTIDLTDNEVYALMYQEGYEDDYKVVNDCRINYNTHKVEEVF